MMFFAIMSGGRFLAKLDVVMSIHFFHQWCFVFGHDRFLPVATRKFLQAFKIAPERNHHKLA